MDLGTIEVLCPHCHEPLRVVAVGRELGERNGSFVIGVSADRDRFATELEQHDCAPSAA
jgi:hypothetical protein